MPAQNSRQKQFSSLLSLFILFWLPMDWMMPTKHWESNLLYSVYRLKMFMLSRNTLTDILKIKFKQVSGLLVAWSGTHTKVTRTEAEISFPSCSWFYSFFRPLLSSMELIQSARASCCWGLPGPHTYRGWALSISCQLFPSGSCFQHPKSCQPSRSPNDPLLPSGLTDL
jgi:hypothetical protein